MHDATFQKFQRLIYDSSGINLRDGKQTMLKARIAKRIRALDLQDERAYFDYVETDRSGEEILKLLEVVSTNLTSFFREPSHFDFVEKVVDQWMEAGGRRLRIWCCASSTGEEPYTLAMVLHRVSLRFSGADIKVLATDISGRVLEHARAGIYDAERVAQVPENYRREYFTHDRVAGKWRVDPRLQSMVVFKWLNLAKPPFPMQGPLDLVMCRNVMIYFDNQTRTRLLTDVQRLLKPGGYLLIGHTETLNGMPLSFERIESSIYRKP